MSRTIDERVVSMQFDNKHFESNVRTSMGTIDKLKQKLNFDGASKGLSNLSSAASKVNMSPLGSAVDAVRVKFSALEVMGVTALANITNSAVNAGKRMLSALTIDPIMSGFQEYETQMNAVQTILANTQSKGTTIDDVNKALAELNTYADKTIYNFTEMTRNIGTFTAAGVDLDTSVNAIQGIANLAAVSGSTSQQAATAMYQLSQALAAGKVQLMDWNSVVNAGMGGEVFQNALKKTSELLGTGAEAAIKAEGSFRESLRTGWLTSEVLTETLKKFTTTGANEYLAEYTGLTQDVIDAETEFIDAAEDEAAAIDQAAEALANKSGKNKQEIKDALQMAYTAQNAATKVKTFTQLWDTMKEASASGWAKTWQLIFGDFEEAKEFWTGISDFWTGDNGVITKIHAARNALLESALGKGFTKLGESLNTIIKPAKTVSKVLDNLDGIVSKVIRGDYGNVDTGRVDKLTEAGYNYYRVQNKVNEALGNTFRHSEKQIEAQDALLGKQQKSVEQTGEQTEETIKLEEADKERLKTLLKMNEAELIANGYTKEQIEALDELRNAAKKVGLPMEEFIDNLDKINGRWLLLEGLKNVGTAFYKVFSSIGQAFKEIFSVDADGLFNLIAGFHKLSRGMIITDETADNLKRTFKGLFAAIQIVIQVIWGIVKLVGNVLAGIFEGLGVSVLEVTARIGDAIVAFRDWLKETDAINRGARAIGKGIAWLILKIKDLLVAFYNLPFIKPIIDGIKNKFLEMADIGKWAIQGLTNALKDESLTIPEILKKIGKGIITAICKVLGIKSPSTEMYEVGVNTMEGMANGVEAGASGLWDKIKGIGEKILNFFKNLDWSKVFTVGLSIGLIAGVKKAIDLIGAFAAPFEGLGQMLEGAGDMLEGAGYALRSFGKRLRAEAFEANARGIKQLAISIAIMAASIAALAWLASKEGYKDNLWEAVKLIFALAAIIVGMTIAVSLISKNSVALGKGGLQIKGMMPSLINIAAALLLVSFALAVIGKLNPEQYKQGLIGIGIILGMFIALIAIVGKIVNKGENIKTIYKLGGMMMAISAALLIMVLVCKLAGHLSIKELGTSILFLGMFVLFVAGLVKVTQVSKEKQIVKVGGMLAAIAATLLLMVLVCKLAGHLSIKELAKSGLFMAEFLLFVYGLVYVSKVTLKEKQYMVKIAGMVAAIAFALLLMVGVCKLASMLSIQSMIKGGLFMAEFLIFVAALVKIIPIIGSEQKMARLGLTLLAMSVAIAILAGISILLGFISTENLVKGIFAVGALGAIVSLMVYSTKNARNCWQSIVAISVAVAIMAGVIAALSLIDPKDLVAPVIAMGALMGMFALIVNNMKHMGSKTMGSLIVMTAMIALVAASIYILAKLPIESSLTSAIGMASVLAAIALAIKYTKGVKITRALKGLAAIASFIIGLTLLAGLFGILFKFEGFKTLITDGAEIFKILGDALGGFLEGVIGGLARGAGSNIEGAIVSLAAIGGIIIAVIVISKLMGKVGTGTKNIGQIISIAVAIGVIAGAIALLARYSPASLVAPVAAIAGVMAAFAYVIKVSGGITSSKAMGNLIVITVMIGIVGLVLMGLANLPVEGSLGAAMSLAATMVAIGLLAGILSKIPMPAALSAVVNLAIFAAGLEGVIIALGAIASIPGAKKLLERGGEALGLIGKAIGGFVGNIVGGFMGGMTSGLPEIGRNLSGFMSELTGFVEGAKTIEKGSFDGLTSLAGAIMAITGADFLSRMVTFGNQETAINKFAASTPILGQALASFSKSIEGVDVDSVKAGAEAGLALALMADTVPNEGGIVAWFAGDNSIAKFGPDIARFGTFLKQFSDNIQGVDCKAVEDAAGAATAIAKMADTVPNEGGIAAWFAGDNSLAKFGPQMAEFGKSLEEFSKSAQNVNRTAVEDAAAAGTAVANMAKEAPNEGGVLGFFAGENSLASFGPQIVLFGACLQALSKIAPNVDPTTIENVCKAGVSLSKMAEVIPNTGGVVGFFAGDNNLIEFGNGIEAFAVGLEKISNLGTIISESAIEEVIAAAEKLAELDDIAPKKGGVGSFLFGGDSDLVEFGNGLGAFATGLKSFSVNAIGISATGIENAVEAAKPLKDLFKIIPNEGGVAGFFAGEKNIATFGTNLESFGTSLVNFASKTSTLDLQGFSNSYWSIEKITDIAHLIPNEGGAISFFTGDNNIATFGTNLESFGKSLSEFAKTTKDLDLTKFEESYTAVENLANIAKMIPNEGGAISFFTGDNNIAAFGSNIESFGLSLVNFADTIAELDTSRITAVSKSDGLTFIGRVVQAVVDMSKLIPTTGGLAAKIFGDTNVGAFGANIQTLGEALASFSTSLGTVKTANITIAGTAIDSINGLVDKIDENNDDDALEKIKTFGTNVETLASKLLAVSDTGAGISAENVTLITGTVNSLKTMMDDPPDAEEMKTLGEGIEDFGEYMGNFSEDIAGLKDNMSGLGTEFSSLGVHLISFVGSLQRFGELASGLNTNGYTKAETAIDKILTMAEPITEDPMFGEAFDSTKLGAFGTNITSLATGLKDFATKTTEIDTESLGVAETAMGKVVGMAKDVPDESDHLSTFAVNVNNLGANLKTFSTNAGSITAENVTAAIGTVNSIRYMLTEDFPDGSQLVTFGDNIASFGNDMAAFGSDIVGIGDKVAGLKTAMSDLKSIGTTGVTAFITAFTTAAPLVKNSVNALIKTTTDTITSKKGSVSGSFSTLLSGAPGAIKNHVPSFVTAGLALANGLISGISSQEKRTQVYNAAYALGAMAAQGVKDGEQSESPSKITIQAGKDLGNGLIIGIKAMRSSVYSASYNMGDEAATSMSNAISKISSLMNDEIDSQPTIRPVLDLTDVSNGVNQMGNMLAMNPSVGVMSSIRAISSSMNNQNGVNDDVVSAIRDLGKNLGTSGDTYSINGITYDDGSNITDAVKTLVRAARMERRT